VKEKKIEELKEEGASTTSCSLHQRHKTTGNRKTF
jgi:hypothetical protein